METLQTTSSNAVTPVLRFASAATLACGLHFELYHEGSTVPVDYEAAARPQTCGPEISARIEAIAPHKADEFSRIALALEGDSFLA